MNETKPAFVDSYQSLIPFYRVIFVLFLRAGSLLVQLGTYPTENVFHTIIHNLADISTATVSYFLIGSTLAFGRFDFHGFISFGPWSNMASLDLDLILHGYCVVLIGTCIITMQLCGRLHIWSCIVITFTYSSCMLPLTMHWTWHDNGWIRHFKIGNQVFDYIDYGGSVIIHSTAGMVGLIGSAFLGRRILQLRDIDKSSISTESPGSSILGYFLLYSGFLAMLLPYKPSETYLISKIIINYTSTVFFGILFTILLQLWFSERRNYWNLVRNMQGGIAALTLVSAGVTNYSTTTCIVLIMGFIPLHYVTTKVTTASALEDHCNIISSHLLAGIIGIIPVHIFQENKTLPFDAYLIQTIWQVMATIIVLKAHEIVFASLFYILSYVGCLRNDVEANCHQRSLNLNKINKQHFFSYSSKSNTLLEPNTDRNNPTIETIECANVASNKSSDIKLDDIIVHDGKEEAIIYKLDDLMHLGAQDECTDTISTEQSDVFLVSKDIEIDSTGYCNNCKSKLLICSSYGSD